MLNALTKRPFISGCDRSTHEGKRQKMEETHRTRIAAVVDEWDEAERRYKKLKEKDPVSAAQKMNSKFDSSREFATLPH